MLFYRLWELKNIICALSIERFRSRYDFIFLSSKFAVILTLQWRCCHRELLCYCAIENHCCEFCCQGCDIWDDCPSCYDRFGLNVILFSMLQLLH